MNSRSPIDPTNLPSNPAALRAMVMALMDERDAVVSICDAISAERDTISAERDFLLHQNDKFRHLLAQLKRMKFGRSSERLPEEQLQLGLEALESEIARTQAQMEKRDADLRSQGVRERRANRGQLPAHLPRIEVVLTPEDTNCPCCRAPMVTIGEDTSERLDVIPAQFRVLVTRRPKLACRACPGTVVQQDAPARLIEGGLPTETLVAHVLVSRFADHLPLYRQAQIFQRQGVTLDRSTLSFWVGYAAAELEPVVACLKTSLLCSVHLFADETGVPVLAPGRGKTKPGYFWTIARDDRPWGGADPPGVVYTYAPGRGHKYAQALLGDYAGILQCDGYGAYKSLADPPSGSPRQLAFCWAHVRRRFYDVVKKGPAPVAAEALQRIAALYQIEATIRGQAPEDRLRVRQAQSKVLVDDMRAWFDEQLNRLLGGSKTVEAIEYAINHWEGLTLFLRDGRVALDTNTVEREIRPIVLSRKNSLFAGSDEGGEHWATVASLIQTCKLNGVNPQSYLGEVMTRLVNGWPQNRIEELLPWAFKDNAVN